MWSSCILDDGGFFFVRVSSALSVSCSSSAPRHLGRRRRRRSRRREQGADLAADGDDKVGEAAEQVRRVAVGG